MPNGYDTTLGQRCPQRILLAEDNVVNQKVALQILRRLGYRADVAANGLEVLTALEQQPYDLVLMDVQMPEMDGLEATRQIAQRWPSRRPQVVAMTANAMQGDRDECLRAGMDDYISKPIRIDELTRVLELSAATCPAPTIPTPAVDLTTLRNFAATVGDNSPNFMADLILNYLESTDQLLAEMVTAYRQQDWPSLKRAAHTLKSSSATVNATELLDLCQRLEASTPSGDEVTNPSPDIAAQIGIIRRTADGVKTALYSALGPEEVPHPC